MKVKTEYIALEGRTHRHREGDSYWTVDDVMVFKWNADIRWVNVFGYKVVSGNKLRKIGAFPPEKILGDA